MKKLLLLVTAIVLAVTLAGCNRDPEELLSCIDDPTQEQCQTVCPTGQELVGENCLDVCVTGEHREGEACVEDTISCPTGQHEVEGACVLDDTRTAEEIAIDYFIENYDGDVTFLSVAMVNMHFEEALTVTTEFNFEVTEDIDEVHYIEATIIDSFVYDETNGNMVMRDIYLDVDEEIVIEFAIILHEVATGVHVYIEAAPLIALATEDNAEAAQTLEWVGLDSQWAVLELDDSLQNLVELEVVKDMVVALFFSEMGEQFFYDIQENQLEPAIGFDLSQYDLDLGLLVDYIIEENWTMAEAEFDGIQFENIALHADAMYIAPHLYEVLMDYQTDLVTAGYNANLTAMLDVSVWNPATEMFDPILPIDPLVKGTKAFLEALQPADVDAIIEVIVKPNVEMMVYEQLNRDANPEWLESNLINILTEYETFLGDNWPVESVAFDLTTELAEIAADGPVIYWSNLTEGERGTIHWAIDTGYHGWVVNELQRADEKNEEYQWFFRKYREEVDIQDLQNEVINFLSNNQANFMTVHTIDTVQLIADIETQGIIDWIRTLDYMVFENIMNIAGDPTYNNEWFEHHRSLVEKIFYDWGYNWNVDFDGEQLHIQDVTNELEWLVGNHTIYLMEEYGLSQTDVENMQAAIQLNNGVEWFLTVATGTERDYILEIVEFEYEYDHISWIVEVLERMYDNQDSYYMWFGRMEEKQPLEELNEYGRMQVEQLSSWISSNTTEDPTPWPDEIEMYGLVGWFESLTEDEIMAIEQALQSGVYVDYDWPLHVIMGSYHEPDQYNVCYGDWRSCMEEVDMNEDMIGLLQNYEGYLLDEYGIVAADEIALVNSEGAFNYYFNHADREVLRDIAEMAYWQYEVMWDIEEIMYMEEDLMNLLTTHETTLNAIDGVDATLWISQLDMYGIQVFVADYLSADDMEILFEELVYPELVAFHQAITDGEIEEFITEFIWNNPHMTMLLTEIGPNPVFDETMIAANLMGIDFDALYIELETFDFELLGQAVYDGQTAYDTYVAGLTEVNVALFLEILSPAVLSAEDYMMYVYDVEYALDNLTLFDQFIDIEYYMDSIIDMEMERTEDSELIMNFELDGIAMAQLFDDVKDQAGIYLAGFESFPYPFDEDWNCIEVTDCEEPEFSEIIAELTGLGSIEGYLLYDPNDLSWMGINIDATDLLNGLAEDEYADRSSETGYVPDEMNDHITGVNEFSVTVTMENTSSITLPTDPDNVNELVDDLAKFAITSEAYHILMDYTMGIQDPTALALELLNTELYLADIEGMEFSMAFDLDMSYIMINVPMVVVPGFPDVPDFTGIDYEIVLYWIDGTMVHTDGLGLAELAPLWLNNELVSQAAYDQMVLAVDDANWSIMKLALYYMWQDNNNDKEEMPY